MTRIVVGVDGSEPSRSALRWALHEAHLRHSDVLAVYAYHSPLPTLDVVASYVDLRPAAVELIADEVAKGLADVGLDVPVRQHVTEGDAGIALVRMAHRDDIVVVGARSHGLLASAILGSTSRYVAAHAPCPVVVVPAPAP